MQTILGAGGPIGKELAKALKKYTDEIRLVSRNPVAINDTDELFSADITNSEAVAEAVAGSDVVYLTVGFPYKLKVWQEQWPAVVESVIDACKKHNAKLVFFDNIYMYDPDYLDGMNEETPINPPSNKGIVRARIAQMVLDAVNRGDIQALIARSADFYGPSIENTSMLTKTVFKNLLSGKKAIWMSNANVKHSFTYTPDAGRATALLGNTEDAFNQIWHLPTASIPPTGKEWVEMIAGEMGVEARLQVVSKLMIRMIGLFVPVMREMVEMLYQYDRQYVFDSTKFENRFDFKPTSYVDGIKGIVNTDYS